MTGERVPTPAELRADQARVRSLFSGGEPEEFRTGLVPIQDSRSMLPGTSRLALQPEIVEHASGLLVPAGAVAVEPLDMIQVFITGEELFGVPMRPEMTVDLLQRMTFADVLRFVAETLAAYRRPDASSPESDLEFAEQWLTRHALRRVRNLLRDPRRVLIVPQAL